MALTIQIERNCCEDRGMPLNVFILASSWVDTKWLMEQDLRKLKSSPHGQIVQDLLWVWNEWICFFKKLITQCKGQFNPGLPFCSQHLVFPSCIGGLLLFSSLNNSNIIFLMWWVVLSSKRAGDMTADGVLVMFWWCTTLSVMLWAEGTPPPPPILSA